eukprot:CAMPEP_0177287396 /NCGR_PEP_ID=MMETSP0367-20130122/74133_1 /TAXON_ID=447022 ORGANISM="Scrippsiella hangoei-like, Strain SHHI-4" /NCGR_SAMPLE_ID=MMETSP0367 /ASSEMBLY_ACC=CAM_ASM_000362 /LENGTH=164 /DNA_ID=CAMNT_0018744705 /DNA_START=72 /DNA_END=563 /DNA_ORIENTATION=-
MAMSGLHKISHLLTTDGSGRDVSIFHDGGWRHGSYYGTGMVPMYHPMFNNGTRVPHFVITPPKGGEAAHLEPGQPAIYKLRAAAVEGGEQDCRAALFEGFEVDGRPHESAEAHVAHTRHVPVLQRVVLEAAGRPAVQEDVQEHHPDEVRLAGGGLVLIDAWLVG